MAVHDERSRARFKAQSIFPTERESFFWTDADDVESHGRGTHGFCYGGHRFRVEVRAPFLEYLNSMRMGLLEKVVHEHHVSSSGGHLALWQFDEGIEHDLRASSTKFLKGEADLLGLQFVVFTKDVDQFIALRPFPLMIGDVPGCVKRGTIATSIEEFCFSFESSLAQVKELRSVFCDAIDFQSA